MNQHQFPALGSAPTAYAFTLNRVAVLAVASLIIALASCTPATPVKSPPVSVQPATPPAPSAPVSNWKVSTSVNKMDGVVTTFLNSSDTVHLHLCYQNKGACSIPVAVQVPCYVESNVDGEYSSTSRRVRVKFDGGAPRTEVWGITDDHHAIFPRRSAAFIAELKKHKSLLIEVGCDFSDTYEQEIAIAGLQDAITRAHVGK
jgi:hypothetical protein